MQNDIVHLPGIAGFCCFPVLWGHHLKPFEHQHGRDKPNCKREACNGSCGSIKEKQSLALWAPLLGPLILTLGLHLLWCSELLSNFMPALGNCVTLENLSDTCCGYEYIFHDGDKIPDCRRLRSASWNKVGLSPRDWTCFAGAIKASLVAGGSHCVSTARWHVL